VIWDEKVAELYKTKMKAMGVEISEMKSLFPTEEVPVQVEFAKRIFTKDGDVSPLPLRLLKSLSSPIREGMMLTECIQRGVVTNDVIQLLPGTFPKRSLLLAGFLQSDNTEVDRKIHALLSDYNYVPKADELPYIMDDNHLGFPEIDVTIGFLRTTAKAVIRRSVYFDDFE